MTVAAPKGRFTGTKVVDVMTANPLTVKVSESVGVADELMAEHNIRQIPVLEGRELIGIVTDRDVRAFLSDALLASAERHEKALATAVGDIMTREPLYLAPDDDLQEAVELLVEQKFGAIPVLDEVEGLVGIVSYVDVLRCFLDRLREEES
jgi:acetoin utilization protein AcuB